MTRDVQILEAENCELNLFYPFSSSPRAFGIALIVKAIDSFGLQWLKIILRVWGLNYAAWAFRFFIPNLGELTNPDQYQEYIYVQALSLFCLLLTKYTYIYMHKYVPLIPVLVLTELAVPGVQLVRVHCFKTEYFSYN